METQEVEFWRTKANDWEWMYREQKDICEGYKNILDEYRQLMGVDIHSKKDYMEKDDAID